jgi:hypothetical protein
MIDITRKCVISRKQRNGVTGMSIDEGIIGVRQIGRRHKFMVSTIYGCYEQYDNGQEK